MTLSAIQTFKQLLQHSAVKFASVGMINTLLSIIVIFSLKYFVSASDVVANAIGYVLGLACSFILNKRWTFNHIGNTWSTIPKFLLVFAISYLINIFTVLMLIKLGVNDYLAHLAGIPPYSVAFYFGSRYFVFASMPKVEHKSES